MLVRADLNVPVKDGKVTDATRLERVVPGLKDLAERGATRDRHLAFRPAQGRARSEISLKPVADKLGQLLGRPVAFAADCIGEAAERKRSRRCKDGDIAVLENLRFHKGEEKNDPAFAEALAKLGDIFVDDAFSAAHRAHASTEAITRLLPSYAGPLMMEEIDALRSALEKPERPTAAVIGGAKVSTKIPVLTNLAAKVDKLIIGGGMANTFFLAQGRRRSASRWPSPTSPRPRSRSCMPPRSASCEVVLPHDVVVAAKFEAGAPSRVVPILETPADADDPRRRPEDGRALHRRARPLQDAAVERPARRLRDRPVRRGHVRAGARGRRS